MFDWNDYTPDQLCAIIEVLDQLDERMWRLTHKRDTRCDNATYKLMRTEVRRMWNECCERLEQSK